MVNETLEQGLETVDIECRSCLGRLSVPVKIVEAVDESRKNSDGAALGKVYDGFYVSPETALVGGLGYYCDKGCYSFNTED